MSQTQTYPPIRIISFVEKLVTAAISIATTGIIACCGFAWNTNGSIVKIEQHLIEKDKAIDDLNIKMNNLQLDIRGAREAIVELKTLQKRK